MSSVLPQHRPTPLRSSRQPILAQTQCARIPPRQVAMSPDPSCQRSKRRPDILAGTDSLPRGPEAVPPQLPVEVRDALDRPDLHRPAEEHLVRRAPAVAAVRPVAVVPAPELLAVPVDLPTPAKIHTYRLSTSCLKVRNTRSILPLVHGCAGRMSWCFTARAAHIASKTADVKTPPRSDSSRRATRGCPSPSRRPGRLARSWATPRARRPRACCRSSRRSPAPRPARSPGPTATSGRRPTAAPGPLPGCSLSSRALLLEAPRPALAFGSRIRRIVSLEVCSPSTRLASRISCPAPTCGCSTCSRTTCSST